MNFPEWYTPERDYIVVHPLHKPNMGRVEELTSVGYFDFISPEEIIFLRGDMGVENSFVDKPLEEE